MSTTLVVFGAGCFDPEIPQGLGCSAQLTCPPEQRCDAVADICRPLPQGPGETISELSAQSPEVGDLFGYSVAADGARIVIGSPGAGSKSGLAHVFERDADGVWAYAGLLRASDATVEAAFGWSVAIHGDRIVVGAPYPDVTTELGTAYVFERNSAGDWAEVEQLIPSTSAANDKFGWRVGINGDHILASAPFAIATVADAGLVYAFQRTGGAWQEVQADISPFATEPGQFGLDIDMTTDRAVISAPALNGSGAVFVYERRSMWELAGNIGTAAMGQFGSSASVDGNDIAIASPAAPGADPSVAQFYRPGQPGMWTEVSSMSAANSSISDAFSIAVLGGYAIIGGITADGDQGAAFGATRDGNFQWSIVDDFSGTATKLFGFDVAVGDDFVVIGEPDDPAVPGAPGGAFVLSRSP